MLTRRELVLLMLLTLFWGVNWPVMKFAVQAYPALTFRAWSMAGGVAVLAVYLRFRGVSLTLPQPLWKPVAWLTLPNMLIWHLFAILGVKALSAGRAAILGYTMPVWALLVSRYIYKERSSRWLIAGVGMGVLGTILLLVSEFSNLAGRPLGVGLMLIAAAGWGWGTVWMRRANLALDTAALTFWMLIITTLAMTAGAILTEPWYIPSAPVLLCIAYNAVIVFGFCHIVWFDLARKLPPLASSLCVMAIPAVGVFTGAWVLHEPLGWQDWLALCLTMGAVSSVLKARRAAS